MTSSKRPDRWWDGASCRERTVTVVDLEDTVTVHKQGFVDYMNYKYMDGVHVVVSDYPGLDIVVDNVTLSGYVWSTISLT